MSLQKKLDELREQNKAIIPSSALSVMETATDDLKNSGILDRVLKPGQKIPGFSLPDIQGEMVNATTLLEKGPLVICFYRGVW